MAKMIRNLRSWSDCKVFLAGTTERKLGHNTIVYERSATSTDGKPSYAVRYHMTDIVTYRPDGRIRLDSNGWNTTTTAQRLNACSPFGVSFSDKDPGVWSASGDGASFRDGMVSDPDGGWQEHKAQVFADRKGLETP